MSNAYNGVAGYNIVMVGVLLFLGNWAGPVYWMSTGIVLMRDAGKEKEKDTLKMNVNGRGWVEVERELLEKNAADPQDPSAASDDSREAPSTSEGSMTPLTSHIALLTLWTNFSLLAVMVACTLLRQHLFIWTVFSPKYLYAMAWSCGFHLIFSCGWSSVLWWVGAV